LRQLSPRSLKLRTLIKDRMKQTQLTYAVLAKKVGVSLPTIKRWLTKDDFPVEALDHILTTIGLSWKDMLVGLDEHEIKRQPLSEKFEEFIASNPKESFVFLLLSSGLKFKEVLKELNLKEKELETILFTLDKNNFIAFRNNKSILPLLQPPFRWTKTGRFSKRYFLPAARILFKELIEENQGFTSKFDSLAPMVLVGESYLSEKSIVRLKADLWELIEKYRETSRHELTFNSPEHLRPMAFLLTAGKFPLWKSIMWQSNK